MTEVNAVDDSSPIMPHRVYEREDLDRLYPALEVAEAVDDEEVLDDGILEHGMQIAKDITEKAEEHGRRRFQK